MTLAQPPTIVAETVGREQSALGEAVSEVALARWIVVIFEHRSGAYFST
jgi:hypothetical protein